jgi:hypothetical protein
MEAAQNKCHECYLWSANPLVVLCPSLSNPLILAAKGVSAFSLSAALELRLTTLNVSTKVVVGGLAVSAATSHACSLGSKPSQTYN